MGTITKALEMLGLFSRTSPEIGLSEFVRLSGREKATVHRHLVELEQNGFLEKNPLTRAYRLGPAILRLSSVREATHPVRSLLRPIVTQLANDTGELAHVSLLQGDQLSPVFHYDPQCHGTQVHFDEAEMLPLHATSSGISILAFSEPEFVERMLSASLHAYTDQTLTAPDQLRAVLDHTRKTGIGNVTQAFDSEVTSQGVALFDGSGQPIGAVSVSVPSVRASNDKIESIRPILAAAAVSATRSLGGAYPHHHPLHRHIVPGDSAATD